MTRDRATVGILAADDDDATMLSEWLNAAGFTPARLRDAGDRCDLLLVRWPVTHELSRATAPMVMLHERGADLAALPRTRVAEFVPLPDTSDVRSLLDWSKALGGALRALVARPTPETRTGCSVDAEIRRRPQPALIAIGVSTGGPMALNSLLQPLQGLSLPPIVIVQHIPASFLADLAARLGKQTGYPCVVASDGVALTAGKAWFAPADRHLRVVGNAAALRAKLTDEPPRRGHRPAAEILFESCAELGVPGIGVLMTGMGQDGAQGLLRLRQRGWLTIGQDEASCAIYGMPRAAKALGAVERELPLAELGCWLAMASRASRASR